MGNATDTMDATNTTVANARSKTLTRSELEQLVAEIRRTTATPAFSLSIADGRVPSLTDTKLGGLPYWPRDGKAVPVRENGSPLSLLAQLRLEDFAGDDRLPDHGLLQFFIDPSDSLSGMDFNNLAHQDGFRVVWHEEVDDGVSEDDVSSLGFPVAAGPWDDDMIGTPLTGEFALDVSPCESVITLADGSFDAVLGRAYEAVMGRPIPDGVSWWELDDEEGDTISEMLAMPQPAHLVFGWPFFTQYDPRGEEGDESYATYDTLLLQVDSDGKDGHDRVLWGDCGIGNFFINGDRLRAGDFSDVMFSWDCY